MKNITQKLSFVVASKKRLFLTGLVLVIILSVSVRLFAKKNHHLPGEEKLSVSVATVQMKPMPLENYFTGMVEPVRSVNIRPQVTGIIEKIAFSPGENVKVGQLLFQIDQSFFLAALKQAKANLQKSQAQLKNNEADVARFQKLVKPGYVSQQQYDQVVSNAAMEKATVAADLANVNQAQIQLDHTRITAPLGGKTGNLLVKEGDLVTANSESSLVTINQLDPVLVDFNLPQNNLPQLMSYQAKNPIQIEVWNELKTKLLGKGELVFVDNTVNSATGTVLLKARVPNPNQTIWPGLMVFVKLILTTEQTALVVPSIAVRVDQEGNFVYVVKDGKAIVRRVVTNRQVGNLTVISNGLKQGEQVITIAPPDLKDQNQIRIIS